jgi:putative DNA primase/helicase
MNAEQETLVKRLIEAGVDTRRFLKLDAEKRAYEKDWPNHLYTPEEMGDHPYWGICGRDGLVWVDADKVAMESELRRILPKTLETKTPRRGLTHFPLIVEGDPVPNKTLHLKGEEEGCGEVRAQNMYVVAAGTEIHYKDLITGEPKIGRYIIAQDRPIAKMQFADFMKAIGPYLGKDSTQKITREQMRNGVAAGTRHAQGIKYATFLVGALQLDNVTALAEMRRWNKLNQPPIENDSDLVRMVENASGYVAANPIADVDGGAVGGAQKYFGLDDNNHISFLPIVFAKDLLKNCTFKTTRDNETAYCFNVATGIYEATGETIIKEEIAKILDECTRQRYYADILFYVKAKTYFDRPLEHPNKLVLNNGILNMETYELEPFSDKEFLQIHVPVTYDPKLGCPLIQQFILEVVGEAQVPLLQEWIGYCLYAKYPIHKAMILLGPGANGKSTLINLIDRFLGEKNKASITLQALCSNRFAASALDGKLVNLCADIPNKALVQTGMFKMLVGADSIPAERKFKDAYTFDNIAKLMFSTNEIPKTTDDTIAYFRRWIIINCTNYFPPGKANTRILDYICTPSEFSGLLNWALIGLKRLLEKGQFSDNRTWEQERERYLASSNSALAYIESHVEYSNEEKDRITKEDLYAAYVTYCKANDLPIMRQADVTTTMRQAIPDAKETLFRVEGQGKHGWSHVTVTAVTTSLLNTTVLNTTAVLSRNEVTEVTPGRNDDKLEEALGHKPNTQGLIQCQECKAKAKTIFFATDADLAAHMKAYHEGE